MTVFSLIGTVMRILWQREPDAAERGHGVRLTWGGPITVEPADFERRFGVRVLPGYGVYGMSEIGMLCMTSDDAPRAAASARRTRCASPSPAGDPLRPARPARCSCDRGSPAWSSTATSTSRRPRSPPGAACWFHTGDLGRSTPTAAWSSLGRRKDMIRRAGHNVAAAEVEEALAAHPDVAESAAVGVPAPLGEEQLVVSWCRGPARADAGPSSSRTAPRSWRRSRPWDRVELVDALPRTATGKVARAELAALAVNGEEAP